MGRCEMSMNASRPELSELTAFATVAAHKSFRRAAEELGLSPSTLSHKMSALESRMGVRLLNRTTRSVAITQAGDALLGRLQPIFHRLDDIVAEGFDAGVRLEEAIPQDMIAVRFGGDTRFVAVASPRYLKDHAPPRSPTDLRKHSCIRFRTRSAKIYRWEFERRGQSYNIDVEGPLTLNDEDLMAQAATDGLGIAFVSERRAASAIKAGKLVVVLDDWCPRIAGLALYYPGHRQVPAGLRAFVEVLRRTGSERS